MPKDQCFTSVETQESQQPWYGQGEEVSRPIFLCYAAASPLRVPFPIDFSCAISKVFLIYNLYHH